MSAETPSFVAVRRGRAPLVVSLPHTGTGIPEEIERRLVSAWLARKDTDWWIDRLYDFAADLDATVVHTGLSRTVIDVNRDPSGLSLYPGQATTELCPATTFDGESLYNAGERPGEPETAERRALYFEPYHRALADEIARLRGSHGHIVLYDCHSIRSVIPRLFDGELPHFNIGTNGGASCDPELERLLAGRCAATPFSTVVNGRFKGGWITRRYGRPADGVHAVQMELACRAYMDEPSDVTPETWPAPYEPKRAARMRDILEDLLAAALAFAQEKSRITP
jgi:N-formylglutamate deformylase